MSTLSTPHRTSPVPPPPASSPRPGETPRSGGRRTAPRHLGATLVVGLALLVFGVPLVMTVVLAFREGPPGAQTGWTLHHLSEVYGSQVTQVLGSTALYALAVAVVSTLGALYLAWLSARTDVRNRWLLPVAMIAIIVTPSLFYAISFDLLAGQRTGLINTTLRSLLGSDADTGPVNVQSWGGMVFVAAIRSTAFSFILLLPVMMRIPAALEEAARLAGAGRARILATVILPVALPSVLGAGILAVIQSIEAFEIPLILGSPAEKSVLSTEIFALLQKVEGADYGGAAALALPVMALIAVLVVWQRRLISARDFTTVSGKATSAERTRLGRTRWLHSLVVLGFVLVALVLPLTQVVQGAISTRVGEWKDLSLRNIERIGDNPQLVQAIKNSWLLTSVGGLVLALVAVLLTWVMVRSTPRRGSWLATSVWMITVLPGILLGVTVFSMVMLLPGTRPLFGTVWLLLFAFFLAAVPVAVRAADGPVRQIAVDLYEAARVHGAGPVRAWLGTVLPLLPPAVLAAWFVSAVVISSNVAVPFLLSTPQTTLLPVEAMTRYRQGDVGLASGLILVNLASWVAVGLLVAVANRLLTRRRATAAPTSQGDLS